MDMKLEKRQRRDNTYKEGKIKLGCISGFKIVQDESATPNDQLKSDFQGK